MGDSGWLIGFLTISITLISMSWGRDYYHQICKTPADCDNSTTRMSCLQHGTDGTSKICDCRNVQKYIKKEGKCFGKEDAECDIRLNECVPGAFCDTTGFGVGSFQGSCKCRTGFIETEDGCETNEIHPIFSTTAKSIEPDVVCETDENCDFRRTHLSCLNKPGTITKVCSCGRTKTFDSEEKQCLSFVGGYCEIKTDENPHPQRCLKHARCKRNKDVYNNPTNEGSCCGDGENCEEFSGQVNEYTDPYRQKCTSDSQCNPKQTFLKCLKASGSKGQKVCECGGSNIYDEKIKECRLEIGNGCHLEVYRRPDPQKCIKDAECRPHKKKDGTDSRQGTCCKPGSTEDGCSKFEESASAAEMRSHNNGFKLKYHLFTFTAGACILLGINNLL